MSVGGIDFRTRLIGAVDLASPSVRGMSVRMLKGKPLLDGPPSSFVARPTAAGSWNGEVIVKSVGNTGSPVILASSSSDASSTL